MKFQKLSQRNAQHIAYRWKYKDIYAAYNMTGDPSGMQEFISEKLRRNNYFEILDDKNQLIGYFSLEEKEDAWWLTVGMRPEMTGKGSGTEFLQSIIDFIHEQKGIDKSLKLAVSLWNERAIYLFQKLGFYEIATRKFNTNGGKFDYMILRRDW